MDILLYQLRAWWEAATMNASRRYILLAVGSAFTILNVLIGFFNPLSVAALIFLIMSIRWRYEHWAVYTAAISFICYAFSNAFAFFFLLLFLLFALYRFLEKRRIKRLRKLAYMSPSKLAGVSYDKPNVEIVIRGKKQ